MSDPYAAIATRADDPYAGIAAPVEARPAPKAPAKKRPKRTLAQEAEGFLSTVNRGLVIGDEIAAGVRTAADVVTGKVEGAETPFAAAANPMGAASNIGNAFRRNMGQQRAIEDDFAERRPLTSAFATGIGNAGTVAVPGGPTANAFAGASRLANMGRGATIAAGTGAAFAAGDRGTPGERLEAASEMATNPLALGLGAVAGGAVRRRPKAATSKKAPTLDELETQKTAAYRAVEESGARYTPEAMDELVTNIAEEMAGANLNQMRHPKAASMLADIEKMRGQSPTLTELDQLRQVVRRDVANASDNAEKFFGNKMIRKIDEFIEAANAESMVTGGADEASGLIRKARDLNTRYRKVGDVTEAIDDAVQRSGSTYSGGNVDNAIRQNMRRVLKNGYNFTPEEQAALRSIVMGDKGQNAFRAVGKLAPSGGLSSWMGIGSTMVAGPVGAAVPLIGSISKHIADGKTRRKVAELIDMMASGGNTALQAEDDLARLAANDPGVRKVYNEFAERLSRSAGVGTASAPRPKVEVRVEGRPEYGVGYGY